MYAVLLVGWISWWFHIFISSLTLVSHIYIISDSVQRWFHIFVPKRLEVDLMRTTATGSDEKPFINSVDVTKLLQQKGSHDKRYALFVHYMCYVKVSRSQSQDLQLS